MIYLTLDEFMEIMRQNDPIMNAADAFAFVYDVLIAEAAKIKAVEPYAVKTIERLQDAAMEVYSMESDITAEDFSDNMED